MPLAIMVRRVRPDRAPSPSFNPEPSASDSTMRSSSFCVDAARIMFLFFRRSTTADGTQIANLVGNPSALIRAAAPDFNAPVAPGRGSSSGRAVRAATLWHPASLRTSRYILVPAFGRFDEITDLVENT